jgi:putative tryptophan/tyrosine transport system substrate-binding protein
VTGAPIQRREFITLLGGAAAAWPVAARAQQAAPGIPRLIYFPNAFPDEPDAQARHKVFRETFEKLGWADGRNVRIEEQWGSLPTARMRSVAAELVRSAPAVIMTTGSGMSEALKLESRTVPVVFAAATDPLASGLVDSMARPGGNLTGFTNYEFSIGGKWLGLLKEAAPALGRVLVIMQPGNIGQQGLLRAVEAAGPSLRVQVVPAIVNSRAEIERAMEEFAKEPNGGLIGLPGNPSLNSSDLIIALAARHRLPAMYTHRFSTPAGGLMSYDTDIVDLYRRAAGYVDRILKGEKPGDLPVQLPTKYDLVINLKTAKALGLVIPVPLLSIADEVIE